MAAKNREVQEAKERATRLLDEATKNAQQSMEKTAKDEQKKTQDFLKAMPPSQLNQSQATSSGQPAVEQISQIEGQIKDIKEALAGLVADRKADIDKMAKIVQESKDVKEKTEAAEAKAKKKREEKKKEKDKKKKEEDKKKKDKKKGDKKGEDAKKSND